MTHQELRDLIHQQTGMDTSKFSSDKDVVTVAKQLQKTGVLSEDLELPKPPRVVQIKEYQPRGCEEQLQYAEIPGIAFTTPGGQERTGGRSFVPVAVIDQLVNDLLVAKEQAQQQLESN